jgi:predicted metal-binding membrane protein
VAVVWLARGMGSMPATMGFELPAFVGVWTLMMAAMMLPSVAPVAALYARSVTLNRRQRLFVFASGYLLVWAASGVPAFGAAWIATDIAANHTSAARAAAGGVFVAFALYQLTPLKRVCLEHCRSPLSLLLRYASFRGRFRDLRVGMHHGAFCLGCCWVLMLLLIALGTMNLLVMVGLVGLVLLEKYHPQGLLVSRMAAASALVLAAVAIVYPQVAPGFTSTGM